MIETPEIAVSPETLTAVIHLTIPRAEIQNVMGPGIGELMATVNEQGIEITGPWFSHHLRMHPDTFDFEIGVPVAQPVTPAGRVVGGRLPASRVARTVMHGDYPQLGEAWSSFGEWIESEGLAAGPDMWEIYLIGPESGSEPADYRTQLNRPLID